MKKPRVALFTPLPPCHTGTADYGASLAAEMEKLVSLSVYEQPPILFERDKFDHLVYQIGNNSFHAGIYKMALRQPGVVVIHEASVHYLIKSLTVNRGDDSGYLDEVLYEFFGDKVSRLTEKNIPIEVPQPHEFLMLRRLMENSRACIVHSHYAERLVRLKGFQGPIGVIPHGVSLREIDTNAYRRKLGLDSSTPLVGIFGYQRPDKQIWECLLMFKALTDALPGTHLLILGQSHPQIPLEQGIRDLGLAGRVLVRGFQTLEDFDGYLGACDAVLNLRVATFGETSGTMMRAFSLARPVLVSDIGAASELPDDVCIKIPRDVHEMQVIAECLKWLLSNPQEAGAIGAQAKRWVGGECTWDRVAQRYVAFLQEHGKKPEKAKTNGARTAPPVHDAPAALDEASVLGYLGRWVDVTSPAGAYFLAHQPRLIRTLQLIPRGDPGKKILEIGCYMQITPALRGLLGYGEVRGAYMGNAGGWHRSAVTARDGEQFACRIDLFNCEVDRYPYCDEFFDTIVCCEVLEHLQRDPMHMMSEINRVLKQHGTLVLTTPNAVSLRALKSVVVGTHPNLFSKYIVPTLLPEARHAREYTPKELLRLFADCGFAIQHIDTTPYGPRPGVYKWLTKLISSCKSLTRLREDCVYIVAQKINPVATRYPAWLYEQV
ncbi:MAG TPA: methyltransferase domain-containing protein [Bryobacteraceae bacterium]|nr:methyltransferase domain-containing protein [Bryobacteraceae bacterium]